MKESEKIDESPFSKTPRKYVRKNTVPRKRTIKTEAEFQAKKQVTIDTIDLISSSEDEDSDSDFKIKSYYSKHGFSLVEK